MPKVEGLQADNLIRASQQRYLAINFGRPRKTKLRIRRTTQQQEIFTIEGLTQRVRISIIESSLQQSQLSTRAQTIQTSVL